MNFGKLLQELEGLHFEELLYVWIQAKAGMDQDLNTILPALDLEALLELGESLDNRLNELENR